MQVKLPNFIITKSRNLLLYKAKFRFSEGRKKDVYSGDGSLERQQMS